MQSTSENQSNSVSALHNNNNNVSQTKNNINMNNSNNYHLPFTKRQQQKLFSLNKSLKTISDKLEHVVKSKEAMKVAIQDKKADELEAQIRKLQQLAREDQKHYRRPEITSIVEGQLLKFISDFILLPLSVVKLHLQVSSVLFASGVIERPYAGLIDCFFRTGFGGFSRYFDLVKGFAFFSLMTALSQSLCFRYFLPLCTFLWDLETPLLNTLSKAYTGAAFCSLSFIFSPLLPLLIGYRMFLIELVTKRGLDKGNVFLIILAALRQPFNLWMFSENFRFVGSWIFRFIYFHLYKDPSLKRTFFPDSENEGDVNKARNGRIYSAIVNSIAAVVSIPIETELYSLETALVVNKSVQKISVASFLDKPWLSLFFVSAVHAILLSFCLAFGNEMLAKLKKFYRHRSRRTSSSSSASEDDNNQKLYFFNPFFGVCFS